MFCPTEVDVLICDLAKTTKELKWQAKAHWKESVKLIVQ